ncbi:hypothetical protein QFC19_001743 [Naganishia cerealis]|uniref:Uncharacterized protein n=1 Tax=Naganishia cerealis TaxID=610337 RepID=A0ACC2WHQ6_9TREE|nr:hypothetical protein QFC19_001743 [Naganishia cerealis]
MQLYHPHPPIYINNSLSLSPPAPTILQKRLATPPTSPDTPPSVPATSTISKRLRSSKSFPLLNATNRGNTPVPEKKNSSDVFSSVVPSPGKTLRRKQSRGVLQDDNAERAPARRLSALGKSEHGLRSRSSFQKSAPHTSHRLRRQDNSAKSLRSEYQQTDPITTATVKQSLRYVGNEVGRFDAKKESDTGGEGKGFSDKGRKTEKRRSCEVLVIKNAGSAPIPRSKSDPLSASTHVSTLHSATSPTSPSKEGSDEETNKYNPKEVFSKERFLNRHSRDFGHLYARPTTSTTGIALEPMETTETTTTGGEDAIEDLVMPGAEVNIALVRKEGREKRRSWALYRAAVTRGIASSPSAAGTIDRPIHRRTRWSMGSSVGSPSVETSAPINITALGNTRDEEEEELSIIVERESEKSRTSTSISLSSAEQSRASLSSIPAHLRNHSSSTTSSSLSSLGAIIHHGSSPSKSTSSCSSGGEHLGGPKVLSGDAFNFRMSIVSGGGRRRSGLLAEDINHEEQGLDQRSDSRMTSQTFTNSSSGFDSIRTDSRMTLRGKRLLPGQIDPEDALMGSDKDSRAARRRARAFLVAGLKLEEGSLYREQPEEHPLLPSAKADTGRRGGVVIEKAIEWNENPPLQVNTTTRKRYSIMRAEKTVPLQLSTSQARSPVTTTPATLGPSLLWRQHEFHSSETSSASSYHTAIDQPLNQSPVEESHSDVEEPGFMEVLDNGMQVPAERYRGRESVSPITLSSDAGTARMSPAEKAVEPTSAAMGQGAQGITIAIYDPAGHARQASLASIQRDSIVLDGRPVPLRNDSQGSSGDIHLGEQEMNSLELERQLFFDDHSANADAFRSVRKVKSDIGLGASQITLPHGRSMSRPTSPVIIHQDSAGASPGRQRKTGWSKGVREWWRDESKVNAENETERGFGLLRGVDAPVDDESIDDQLALSSSVANFFNDGNDSSLLTLLGDYILPADTGLPDLFPRNINASNRNPAQSGATTTIRTASTGVGAARLVHSRQFASDNHLDIRKPEPIHLLSKGKSLTDLCSPALHTSRSVQSPVFDEHGRDVRGPLHGLGLHVGWADETIDRKGKARAESDADEQAWEHKIHRQASELFKLNSVAQGNNLHPLPPPVTLTSSLGRRPAVGILTNAGLLPTAGSSSMWHQSPSAVTVVEPLEPLAIANQYKDNVSTVHGPPEADDMTVAAQSVRRSSPSSTSFSKAQHREHRAESQAIINMHSRELQPAKLFFLLGFLLGPWVWLLGGWGLSPAGYFSTGPSGIPLGLSWQHAQATRFRQQAASTPFDRSASSKSPLLPPMSRDQPDKWVKRNRWAAVASAGVFIPAMCAGFAAMGTLL